MDEDDKVSIEQAIELLPEGEYIHTFRNAPMMLLGADWSRVQLIEAMRSATGIVRTGPLAQSMKHGLAIENDGSLLFIATKGETNDN